MASIPSSEAATGDELSQPYSILMCANPAKGHVIPTLVIAKHLHDTGHRVRFMTGEAYRDHVRRAGVEFLPLPPGGTVDLDHPNEAFPERVGLTGVPEVRFSMINLFIRPGVAQYRAIQSALEAEPVDAVLAEITFIGAALLVEAPRDQRPAVFALGISPLSASDVDVAPYGMGIAPMPGTIGRLRNRVLQFVAMKVVFAPVLKEASAAYMATIGFEPRANPFDWAARAERYLQFTVPGFEYPRRDLPAGVRFLGPVSRNAPGDASVPEWWGDLDSGRPVVHVTQGTVANADLSQLVRPTLDALANEDVLVVVTTGGAPSSTLSGPLPANARVGEYLPYDKLFPKLSVFVSNGGYGGLHFALEHGVPIVAAGTTEDKIETTQRVAYSGAGINLRTERPTPDAIRDAVLTVLSEPGYRRAAARIGAAIAASPGPAGVGPELRAVLGERPGSVAVAAN